MRRLLLAMVSILSLPALANAQNQRPVVNSGEDQTVYTDDWVTLYGSAYDPEGSPIIWWTWEVVEMPPNGLYRLFNADTQNLQLLGYVQGDYVVSLTAGDGTPTGFDADYATVHVRDNLPPVAVAATTPTSIAIGGTICFDGSESYDPEFGPLTYVWDFADGTSQVIGVATCHVFGSAGTFGVTLAVTDVKAVRDLDVVVITVLAPAAVPALPRSGLWLLALLLSLASAAQISRRAGTTS